MTLTHTLDHNRICLSILSIPHVGADPWGRIRTPPRERLVRRLPGQSWDKPGLRGILAMRALVLSDRWSAAWLPCAATHHRDVRVAA